MGAYTFGAPVFFIVRQSALLGVDLFLVLSGFFTAGYLFAEHRKTGRISWGGFFSRRARKIYPSYALAVLIMFIWQAMNIHQGTPLHRFAAAFGDLWIYLAHLQNYRIPRVDSFIQTWTLALLIQFYIGFATLLYALNRFGRGKTANPFRAIPWLFAISIPLCFFLRLRAANRHLIFDPWTHNFPLEFRLDEILAGVWIAYLVVYARPAIERFLQYKPLLILFCLASILPVALRKIEAPWFLHVWGYTLAGFGCAGGVLYAWSAEQRRRQADPVHYPFTRLLAFIGVMSYSIYIWHMPFGPWVGLKVGNKLCGLLHLWGSPFQYWLQVAVYFSIAIAGSWAMYVLIERPSNRSFISVRLPSPPSTSP